MNQTMRMLLLCSLVVGLSTSISGCERFWKFVHEHHHEHHDDAGVMDAGPKEDAGVVEEDAGSADEDAGGALTICGGLLGVGCEADEFCKYAIEASCGAADQTGLCVAIPELCTFEYAPVCGCDDLTYDNACLAAAAGVSVAALGECAPL